jgi:hypothetical protein
LHRKKTYRAAEVEWSVPRFVQRLAKAILTAN